MTDFPKIRVGVDWDGDGEIDYDDLSTDLLNIFPDNAILRDDQNMSVGGATWAVVADESDYSPFCYHIVPGGGGTRGIAFSTQSNFYATAKTTPSVFESGSLFLAAGEYTLSTMIKRVGSPTPLTVNLRVYDEAYYETGVGFLATTSPTVTDVWTQVSLTFTVPLGGRYLHMQVTQGGSQEIKLAYRATLIAGATALPKFNDGTLRLYDDITDDILSFNSKSGRTNPDDQFPSEGTLSIRLYNDDRKYSREYVDGPLYGQFKKNRKIEVAVQHPTTLAYQVVWTGWTRGYSVTPGGTTGDLQAEITAEQGIFRLNDMKPVIGILTDTTFDTLLDTILSFGWLSAASLAGVGDKSRWDQTMYFAPLDDVRTASGGVNTFPVVGDGWGETTTAAEMLKEMLEVERGYFYIDRAGKIIFRNRHNYREGFLYDLDLSLDTEAMSGTYEYGGNVQNVIKVSYYPKEYVDGSIWTTRERLAVPRRESKEFEIKFEYEEGTTVSVSELLPFQVGSSTIVAYNRKTGGTIIPAKFYRITTELKNGSGKLTITNKYGGPLYFVINLWGTRIVSYGSQTYTAKLDEYSTAYESLQDEGLREKSFSNKLIMTEDDAIGIGDYLLARYGIPRSMFKTFKIGSRNAEWLTKQLDISIGTYVQLTEYQTAFVQKVVVVGENITWKPGYLETTYTVTPPEFYTVSIISGNTNSIYVGY